MVLTRSVSQTGELTTAKATTAATTTTTTTGTTTTAITMTTTTATSTGAVPKIPSTVPTTAGMDSALGVDESMDSNGLSTIPSPPFSSLTAQSVRDAY